MKDSREKIISENLKKLNQSKKEAYKISKASFYGATAEEISEITGYDRSNVSRELNRLYKSKKVIKVKGKPVYYLHKDIFNDLTRKGHFSKDTPLVFEKLQDFLDFLKNGKKIEFSLVSEKKQQEIKMSEKKEWAYSFSKLIGHDKSLKNQVKQATAAILYPPKGLDTLLVGDTGVGKTAFANIMYNFAIESKRLKKNAPYVVFNCADYSGNSQLLLSHLFGHKKGSFTGADKDKSGIVEKADHGILFLDEVHRLPPEGQEMLFTLMDNGEYRMLGESDTVHHVHILIIAATTESLDKAVLNTFLRRIPNIISIPNIEERSIEERMELIMLFFNQEAKKIDHPICVSNEVVKFFLIYECKYNIGQLRNDIQLICASAFVEMISKEEETIHVKLSQLSNQYGNFLNILGEKRDFLSLNFDWPSDHTFIFDSSNRTNDIEDFLLIRNQEKNFYENIENISKQYFNKGLDKKEIIDMVDKELVQYFMTNNYYEESKTLQEREEPIYKIISKREYDFLSDILISTVTENKINLSNTKEIIGIVLHLEALIERIRENKTTKIPRAESILKEDSLYYKMAEKIVRTIEISKKMTIPQYEINLIAVFLESLTVEKSARKVGILVLTHGRIARELADVANVLLKSQHAHFMCMPLDEKVSLVLERTKKLVQRIDEGKGVLLLVDMGSLTSFGDIISQQTNISIKTVTMASTLTVLEATRLAQMSSSTLETIEQSLKNIVDYPKSARKEICNQSTSQLSFLENEKLLKLLENVLTFLDSKKAVSDLNEVYEKILDNLGIDPNSSLYIKFIFHTTCMLERVIKGETYGYNHFKQKLGEYKKLFVTIKQAFIEIDNAWGVAIPDSELAYVTEIFIFFNKPFITAI